jgi:transglycosylase-like protein with SLT domain
MPPGTPRARARSSLSMRRTLVTCVAVVLASGCGSGGSAPPFPTSVPGVSLSGTPGVSASPVPDLDPHGGLSRDPGLLAIDLAITRRRLLRAIDAWAPSSLPSTPAPEDVQLLALHQQRIYGLLAESPELASATLADLTGSLARDARANVGAGAAILSTVMPTKSGPGFKTGTPDPAAELRAFYDEAEARFGIAWQVLAAVNFVETRFGRVRSASYASARGPMQFIRSTWKAYGLGGNVHDPHDAILGAANYLAASGAPNDYRAALSHYNPSRPYVKAVWLYARQMMRDPREFLVYYSWQVFVITTKGVLQLTGPGAEAP